MSLLSALAIRRMAGTSTPASPESDSAVASGDAFPTGLLSTLAPVGVLSLLSTGGAVTGEVLWWSWQLAWIVWGAVLIATLGVFLAGRRQFAAGMLTGWALGFLLLFATC